MFIKRLITTVILIPLVIGLIFFTQANTFQFITLLLALFCAWEWSRLAGLVLLYQRLLYLMLMLAVISVGQFVPYNYMLWLGTLWWLVALVLLWMYSKKNIRYSNNVMLLIGFLVIVPFWFGFNALRIVPDKGSAWVMAFLCLLWATDIGAYLVGSRWGRRKIAPSLSPGKTYEGVLGGLGLMLVMGMISALWLKLPFYQWPIYALISLVSAVISIAGDLFESMLKRLRGVKDSGHILPGHGGMLDRLDSALAAAPVFALLISLAGLH